MVSVGFSNLATRSFAADNALSRAASACNSESLMIAQAWFKSCTTAEIRAVCSDLFILMLDIGSVTDINTSGATQDNEFERVSWTYRQSFNAHAQRRLVHLRAFEVYLLRFHNGTSLSESRDNSVWSFEGYSGEAFAQYAIVRRDQSEGLSSWTGANCQIHYPTPAQT